MLILDTDILSHLFEGTPRVVEALEGADDEICTTVVNRIEMLRGRFEFMLKAADGRQLTRAQSLLDKTIELLGRFAILSVDELAAARFDGLLARRKHRKIGRADLLIASITLSHQAVIVTRNVRDFEQIGGLTIENWLE